MATTTERRPQRITPKLLARSGWRKRKGVWYRRGRMHDTPVVVRLWQERPAGGFQATAWERGFGFTGEFNHLWNFRDIKDIVSFAMTSLYRGHRRVYLR